MNRAPDVQSCASSWEWRQGDERGQKQPKGAGKIGGALKFPASCVLCLHVRSLCTFLHFKRICAHACIILSSARTRVCSRGHKKFELKVLHKSSLRVKGLSERKTEDRTPTLTTLWKGTMRDTTVQMSLRILLEYQVYMTSWSKQVCERSGALMLMSPKGLQYQLST